MGVVAERYRKVRRRIEDAADVAGRDPSDVTMIAVTKTVPPGDIRNAVAAGMRDFGENRAQEFLGKYGLFPEVRWHFIGTLQSNKVKDVVGRAHLIHSVDRPRLLELIDRQARSLDLVQDVLLQVNVSAEESKHGMRPDEAEEALRLAEGLPGVRVRGLMTMAPLGRPEEARPVFRGLAALFARLRAMRFNGGELEELSMGMSNDLEVAVEEGATMVRVGRAIFGR